MIAMLLLLTIVVGRSSKQSNAPEARLNDSLLTMMTQLLLGELLAVLLVTGWMGTYNA